MELREINSENWRDAVELKIAEAQKGFVAPNWYSLLEALYDPDREARAIYAGDAMVGFVLYGINQDDKHWWIARFMIGEAHQKKGYGRQALRQIIDHIKANAGCDVIYLSFVTQNDVARKLYASEGFVDTGRVEEGEIIYRLDVG